MAGEDSEASRERALSAVGFLLLVFGLAAVLQMWGFLHVTSNSVDHSVLPEKESAAQTVQIPYITDSQGSSMHADTEHETQEEHVSATNTEIQKMMADYEVEKQNVKTGYGSIIEAHHRLIDLLSKEPKLAKCPPPRVRVLDRCTCPAGSKWDGSECAQTLGEMFFYMYRAQSDHNYVMVNVDMADLPGVMYYLHHEIIKNNATPGVRMNGITRILRFLVSMRPSPELARQMKVFMPFVAFDEGRCSVPGCNKLWSHYGFAVGCQKQGASTGFAYSTSEDASGAWFSLPGACPALSVGDKDTLNSQDHETKTKSLTS